MEGKSLWKSGIHLGASVLWDVPAEWEQGSCRSFGKGSGVPALGCPSPAEIQCWDQEQEQGKEGFGQQCPRLDGHRWDPAAVPPSFPPCPCGWNWRILKVIPKPKQSVIPRLIQGYKLPKTLLQFPSSCQELTINSPSWAHPCVLLDIKAPLAASQHFI